MFNIEITAKIDKFSVQDLTTIQEGLSMNYYLTPEINIGKTLYIL